MIKKRKNNTKKTKIVVALILGIVFLIGIHLIVRVVNNNQQQEIIEVQEKKPDISFYQSLVPVRNWLVEKPTIGARSAIVAYIDSSGNKKFVFEKEENLKVPIASITKLMTALVVLEQYDLEETIIITEEAFSQDISRQNNFYIGEQYKVKDLLYPLLMESSNAVAYALAQRAKEFSPVSIQPFVDSMNQKAKELGMNNTFFVNSSGLDPSSLTETANYSTAKDLVVLTEHLLDKPLIWEILSLPEFNLVRMDGFQKHTIINTNILLQEIPEALGGKTGTTSRALQCLVLVTKKNTQDYLISVVLGSSDRFNETKEVLNWVNASYYWEIIE